VKEKLVVFAVALLMVAFVPGVSFSQDEAVSSIAGFAVKAGIDLGGELEAEGESVDMEMGFTLGAEFLFPLGVVNLGPGLAFQIPRGVDEEGATGKVGLLPLYAAVNIPIRVKWNFLPFVFGRFGYSVIIDDSAIVDSLEAITGFGDFKTQGGIYWGIGVGVLLTRNVQVEFCCNSHNLKASSGDADESVDVGYTHGTLSVGYQF
jgi:hypothetical protein